METWVMLDVPEWKTDTKRPFESIDQRSAVGMIRMIVLYFIALQGNWNRLGAVLKLRSSPASIPSHCSVHFVESFETNRYL